MSKPNAPRVPSKILRAATLAALFGSPLVARDVRAQEFAYCDLAVASQRQNLTLNGDATVVSGGNRKNQGIVVTTETANQHATIFHTQPITFTPGGSVYQHFRVRISGQGTDAPPNGADGFSFMLQNAPAGLAALGVSGEGFGYAGITQSVALELDTYRNNNRQDPDGNHISLDTGGNVNHTADGAGGGAVYAGAAEGSKVKLFQPVSLNNFLMVHSLESTTASWDTRDVWIDYVCTGVNACTAKVYISFNAAATAATFADPTNPATLPTKPATPILEVDNLSDVSTYLNGTTGYAGFSASTGGSKDEHLVTYWVLSQNPLTDQNTNHLEDVCDCKNVTTACGGNIPICDTSVAQGFCRGCQSNAECAAKDPSKPTCDSIATGGSGACVQCLVDANCPAATRNCDTTTNTCTAKCTTDAQCAQGQWCSDPGGAPLAGTCLAKLPNGTPVPTVGNHAPALNGICTASVGAAVCATGVCDTADNKCGIALGDGTCVDTTDCRSGVCITSGANSGKCEPCAGNTDCTAPGALVCDTNTNQCVGCTQNGNCSGNAPICNTSTHTCTPCDGDAGSGSAEPCPATAPYCGVGGACTANCVTDQQCGLGNWCNNITLAGVCGPTLSNGTPVPGGTCTVTLGARACTATVCDTTNQECGIAEGDGTCTKTTQCQAGVCVTSGPNATKCEPCNGDGDCPGAVCNASTNHCVQCTGSSSSACTGGTPICNVATGTCTGCTSDLGVSSAEPCASSSAPYCASGGACGHCSNATDCVGATHAGPFCVGGACTSTCSSDQDCTKLQWCDGAGNCEAKLPNGSPLPTAPPIDGDCTPTNGGRVCLSAVCDPDDNKCGFPNGSHPPNDGGSPDCRSGIRGPDGKCGLPNGDGPCTVADGPVVCRSGVCDPDGKCGLGNGDGPCTSGTGPTVCRSGNCNTIDGTCGSLDGGIPRTDGGLSCPGGAIGSDGKCGYPNGEGPCTATNGGVVCRSGKCDTSDGKCEAVDASVPVRDASACPGGVVGSDGQCGYPNGEGPCTTANQGTVCRSGVCSAADGLCGDPPGTGDCSSGAGICRSGVCDGSGTCGCVADSDCGGPASGRVCEASTKDCRDGCRGTGGNSCPTGVNCSSTTQDIGTCGGAIPTGTGGASVSNVVDTLAGGGCACSVPTERSGGRNAALFALALVAGTTLSRRGSRARRQRR